MDREKIAVKFNLIPEMHHLHMWSFAYKQSRKGHWEQFARDRDRFSRRIKQFEQEMTSILSPMHREKIYTLRFQNSY